jgi:DNA-binding CsgD family transcriptional regulator/tetratricopeptide (TPR) repeat protein
MADVAQAVEVAASGHQVVAISPVAGDVINILAAELRRLGPIRLVRAPEDLPARDEGGLAPEERALLSLLAQGVALGSAATSLHMSRRTADRRLARARRRLGVTTTTEAVSAFRGLQAPSASVGLGSSPLIGLVAREGEVTRLTEVLTAEAGGALVVADAAVGKTALLRATVESGGFRALTGGGQLTMALRRYWPLRRALGGLELSGDPEAVASLVASVVGPDLLVIDDLHLADPETVDVLGALTGRISVLGAARPDPPGAIDGPVSRLREAGLVVIGLDPLADADVSRLARRLSPDLPPDRIERIVAGAGGLPLMAEFLSGMDPDAPLGRGLLPVVEGLAPEEFDLALRLALAMRPLPGGDLATALVSKGVATPTGEAGIRIRHALVAEAIVGAAGEQAIAAVHRDLATHALDDAVAAQHWRAAGDLDRAAACAAAAARNSTSLVDKARLLRLVAQCSDGTGRPPPWLKAAAALSEAGLHEEALAVADSVDRSDLTAEEDATASLICTRGLWHRGDAAAALACAAAGVASAERGTREEAVLTLERIRCETMSTGVQDQHRQELARVATIIGEGPGAAALLNVSGLVAYHGGGQGQQEWAAGLVAGETLEDTDSLMRCGNNLVAWHESSGDQETGLALAFRMSDRAAALGLGEWQAQFSAMAANLLYHRGRYSEALELAERVEERALDRRTLQQARLCRVAALIDLGLSEAADQVLPNTAERDSPDWLADNTTVYLRACLAENGGRTREALVLLERFDGDLAFEEVSWFFARPVRAWAEFDLGLPVTPADRTASLPLTRGLLLETQAVGMLGSDPLGAAVVFDRAAQAGRAWSVGVGLRAAWGAAEALRRARRPEAEEALLKVEADVAALGMEPLLARVRRSLRQLGLRRSAPRATDRSGLLTAREREVLDLVAGGASYEQVARRLGVGRPTVRRLMGNAQLKLGADTRLAAIAALPLGQ